LGQIKVCIIGGGNMPDAQYVPLYMPDTTKTDREWAWTRVPIFGWQIADLMWLHRMKPIVKSIETQLLGRSRPSDSIWGTDDLRIHIARVVCKAAMEEMGWPNDHFIPMDPGSVVFWAHEDGLDAEMACLEIRDQLNISLDGKVVNDWIGLSLGDVVADVVDRVKQAHGLSSVWPPSPDMHQGSE
jgi:hypothetical protein